MRIHRLMAAWFWLGIFLGLLPFQVLSGPLRPSLMLANVYRPGLPLADYWVSEKFDGVRAYWDGEKLLSRQGNPIAAPGWFIHDLPRQGLDGELWAGRGRFEQVVSIIQRAIPDEEAWRSVRFMVFDLPEHPGVFTERNAALQKLLNERAIPWVQPVTQSKVANDEELQKLLMQTVKAGGEGLMLHRGGSLYCAERNDDLLKLKPYQDAEARVLRHLPGKGKYADMLGALLVETPEGLRFRLGSGFSDLERRYPPPVGSWVTYRYIGVHEKSGIPRFARYLRIRSDWNRDAAIEENPEK